MLGDLAPKELVEDAVALDLMDFLARHGTAPLLLVRLPEGDTELQLGLSSTRPIPDPGAPKISEPLPFSTALEDPSRPLRSSDRVRREEPNSLRRLLAMYPYFAVPVRKRGDSFMGRISIGRARNKDIVLRHASVSKFHAWFEADESEDLYVSDAGSTNLTHVNGLPIEPRAKIAVEPGDSVRFGAIETVLCSPRTLWTSLRG
jgi:hypothetical protein